MKLLLKLSIVTATLFLLAIALLLILVNPNDYKPEIQAQVKTSINRDLHINGDIGWTFFPQLGFSSGEIILDNLDGFSSPHLVKINQASLGINILPLLKGEISIGELTLDGFELTLLTAKNGVSNLDNMGAENNKAQSSEPTSSPSDTTQESNGFFDINKTQLAGININNAIIELEDLQAQSYQKITINEIKLGQFALDQETDLVINTKVIIDDLKAEVNLNAQLLVDTDLSNIQLNQLQVSTLVTTNALINGQLNSLLKTDINYAMATKKITLSALDINTVITGDNLPNKKITSQVNADINYQLDNQLATINSLKLKVDEIELAGEVSAQTANVMKVRYRLVANEWDLNRYITKSEKTESKPEVSTAQAEAESEIEPDLSFLKGLDIDGTLKIAGIKVDNIKIGEITKRLIINNGKAQIKPLTAQLYQGLLTMNAEVDESKGRNKYQVTTKLNKVQIHPLLIDVAELDILSGTTSFNFAGKGQGLTATKIKQGLVGQGEFKLLEGELYGVNIPQELRSLKAKLTGGKPPSSDSIKKTDFASLTGNFTIDKGLVNNQKLLMLSPIMRLDGSGLVHILKETLDYKLSITPLSKSKEDTDYVDLTGLTIPLLITGTFTEPKFKVDTDSALKEQLQAKLKAEQKRLQEKADKALKKHSDKLDAEAQQSIKKESKRLEDKLKKFF